MNSLDRKQAILNLKMSETFNQLVALSQTAPLNTADEIKVGQASCLIKMCDALDNKRIHFDRDEDAAFFSTLLIITLMDFFDGNIPMEQIQLQ